VSVAVLLGIVVTSGAEVVGTMRIGPRGTVADRSGFLEEGVQT
jgi:hypothetical protein